MLGSIQVLPGLLERSFRSHRAIYVAIRERNPKKAASAMQRHIQDLQKTFEVYRRGKADREHGALALSRLGAPAQSALKE